MPTRRQFQALRPGLIFNVHVVQLNLAKAPQVTAVHDLFKARVIVVHGKTEMPDTPVGQRGGSLGQQIVLEDNVPQQVTGFTAHGEAPMTVAVACLLL